MNTATIENLVDRAVAAHGDDAVAPGFCHAASEKFVIAGAMRGEPLRRVAGTKILQAPGMLCAAATVRRGIEDDAWQHASGAFSEP